MGRKALPDDQRKGGELRIRLTPEDRAMLDQAAEADFSRQGKRIEGRGVTSTWARDILLRTAERRKKA